MSSFLKPVAAAMLAGAALSAMTPQPLVFAAQAVQAATDGDEDRVTRLSVRLTGAASDRGAVWVGLYPSQEAYDAGEEIADFMLAVEGGAADAVFHDLKPGRYALIAFHDENGDSDFTRNFMGIPQERYGFSNNPRPRFRSAHWEEAVFELSGEEDAALVIELVGAGG